MNFFMSGHIFFVVFFWFEVFYIVVRLLKKYIPLIFRLKISKHKYEFYFAIGEAVVWSAFLLITANWLLKKSLFFGIAFIIFILSLLIVLVFVYFRDYISGLELKMENNIMPGDYIEFEEVKGRVISLNVRNIEVETESGTIVYIPYHLLSTGKITLKRNDSTKIQSYTFEFEYDISVDSSILEAQVVKFLYGLPWVRLSPPPSIIFDNGKAKIVVYPVAKEYVYEIEKSVKEKFEVEKDEETS
jgi:small-conductance mechanosensitive channel